MLVLVQFSLRFLYLPFLCALFTFSTIASAEETGSKPWQILKQEISAYKKLYPDILFLNLKGGEDTLSDMTALDLILGYQPVNLDYEHTPKLREDLLYVSVNRVYIMLQNMMPSASLFKADNPQGWQETVCVLTINPDDIAAHSFNATRHLLSLPDKVIKNIPENLKLNPEYYLRFVIHHEIFHCLQSKYIGPQLMSDKSLWGEYNQLLDELGADAYAMAMHIRNSKGITEFANNIKRIRGMSLYNADPDHLTCSALDSTMSKPVKDIIDMKPREVLDFAHDIKLNQNISYDDYLVYLSSAVQAMKALGIKQTLEKPVLDAIKNITADDAQVNELIKHSTHCMTEIKTD